MENEPNTFTVRLFKRPPHGLGFLVRKRKTNPPVIISDLIPDGVADQSGLIQVGDILLGVNGVQLTDVTYSTALEVLRSVPMDSPTVLVMRGPDGYRTRLESILTPDGIVKVVRVTEESTTDSLPREGKSLGGKKHKRDAGSSSPPVGNNSVPCWQRNPPNYDGNVYATYGGSSTARGRVNEGGSSYRYSSPIRSSSRNRRESSRSPARSSLPASPVRGAYPYRDASACCCTQNNNRHPPHSSSAATDFQNVLAWNGTFPRDVYQFRLGIEDLYNFDSPRPSVDYDYETGDHRDRLAAVHSKNCTAATVVHNDGFPERPLGESVGTQWPERVIVVHGTSPSSAEKQQPPMVNGGDLSVKVTDTVANRQHIDRQDSATQIRTEDAHSETTTTNMSNTKNTLHIAHPISKSHAHKEVPSPVKDINYEGDGTIEVNNNTMKLLKVQTAEIEVQTEPIITNSNNNQSSGNNNGTGKPKYVRLKNLLDGKQTTDTLHQKSQIPLQCSESRCMGSIMFPPRKSGCRPKEELILHATDFINQYYTHIKRVDTPAHKKRLQAVLESIEKRGTYDLTETELILGAKTAWRNAPRCIGRIQWTKLQVFDARNTSSAHQMFDAICNHMSYATNKGNLRSAITIFPHRTDGKHDFRVWNPQLVSYAGYKQTDGSIIGDPANVEFTEICSKMGWHPQKQGSFDVLPLILQSNGEDPEMYNIPPGLVLEVEFSHPKYDWFAELGLKWYALPAVSSMMLDLGGLEFIACPFNGWYMVTEIGARDICDPNRLNYLETIGKKMGLETKSNASLWKDQALVEANVAVIHSFQKSNVTITDHHSAAESFLKHMENEQRLRGGCPADWVWVVPPISGSITPVFHQEMLNYQLKPSYEYQDPPWTTHVWKTTDEISSSQKTQRRRRTFKEVAKAVKFSAKLMGKALAKRFKATILYATETGRSEKYAKSLCEIFKHAFDAKVMCMEEYDVVHLEHETLLLIVSSTFGNGDAPENGEEFGRYLMDLARDSSDDQPESRALRFDKYFAAPSTPSKSKGGTSNLLDDDSGVLANVRFAVFGLGSTAYPNFCAYARAVDTLLGNLGGERIMTMGEADELSGQEESYRKWAQQVFQHACDTFCVGEGINMKEANASLMENDQCWTVDKFRVNLEDSNVAVKTCEGLSKLHGKNVSPCILLARKNLQASESSRSTILLHMDTQGASELLYEPGDHVAICPGNESGLVQRIIKRVDLGDTSPDAVIKVEFMHVKQTPLGVMKAWIPTDRIPRCSLRVALEKYLDITMPPTPNFLRQLALLATNEKEKNKLDLLSKDTRSYEEWKFDLSPNLAEVLDEFPSAKPPGSFLLTELPLLKPRFYSISSSTRMYPGEIHATVAVVCYRTHGGEGVLHHGVCSSWLNSIKIGAEIPSFIRAAPNFHLPEKRSDPVIMVGPGTGIAPFRSFWQQRQIDMRMAKDVGRNSFGDMTLVFGCRQSNLDDLYRHETVDANKEGALKEVLTALSREKGKPKKYVQHMLKERGKDVFKCIDDNNGHFFVCGDVSMAADVCNTLESIVSVQGRMSSEEAKNYVISLRDQNRYHEDIFGVTLRTEEVKIKQRTAMRRAQVYITGADSKLTPAIQADDRVMGHGGTKSVDDMRPGNKTDADLNRPPSPTSDHMQLQQPRMGRRSITATVLMSEDDLKELNRTFDKEQNSRSKAINGHRENKK